MTDNAKAGWFVGIVFAGTLLIIGYLTVTAPKPEPAVLGIYVFTDSETGCQYVSAYGRGAVTPRLDAAGKQMCGSVK